MPTKAPIVSQFRYSRFTGEDYNRDVALMECVDRAPCITFGQFRILAKRQGWTVISWLASLKVSWTSPSGLWRGF